MQEKVVRLRPRRRRLHCELMEARRVLAASPFMLTDLQTQPSSSHPAHFAQLDSLLYFSANGAMVGKELWKSDGTSVGTLLATEIVPGVGSSSPTSLIVVGSQLFFLADDGAHGRELWRSDGTLAGTHLVKDICSGGCSSGVTEMIAFNNQLYFSVFGGNQGRELWTSDGTLEGTQIVKDINPGSASSNPSNLHAQGDTLYFTADDGTNGVELWKSDGTGAGTELIADILTGGGSSAPRNLTQLGDVFLFNADDGINGRELWRSDGTNEGTFLVANINVDSSSTPELLTTVGTLVYFSAADSNGRELWKSDGTSEGTVLVRDILPGSGNSFPEQLIAFGSQLLFTASHLVGFAGTGRELWKSDGTESGTTLVADIRAGSLSSNPSDLTVVGNAVYFSADDGSRGRELWISDGTEAGTEIISDIVPGSGSSGIASLIVYGEKIFFEATTEEHGSEFWTSDGTEAGTTLVKDINTSTLSSSPSTFVGNNGVYFFTATTPALGREIWRTEGTAATTQLLHDISPTVGSSNPSNLTFAGSTLFFSASNNIGFAGVGTELWMSDGTEQGTRLVKDIYPGQSSSSPQHLAALGESLLFSAQEANGGRELWRSDGTEQGTYLVKNIRDGAGSSSPQEITVIDGQAYFSADDGIHGRELWISNGTAEGTERLSDIATGSASSSPASITALASIVLFIASSEEHGRELWKTDGTPEGTTLVADLRAGSGSSNPADLIVKDGLAYFTADTVGMGRELWRTDGTETGTTLVADIRPGTGSSAPQQLIVVEDTLFFVAEGSSNLGRELWKSDGTESGTRLVKEIAVGSASSAISNLNSHRGRLLFLADDQVHGKEVWQSDGTAEGTILVADVWPGIDSSIPAHLMKAEELLFFSANDGVHSHEPWGLLVGSAPVNVILTPIQLDENQPAETPAGTLSTLDPSHSDQFIYQLVSGDGGDDNLDFAIVDDLLITQRVLNFEEQSEYSIRVRSTDSGGESFERSLRVSLSDVNDPPTLTTVDVLQSAGINAPYIVDYADLLARSNAFDEDLDDLEFVVTAVHQGELYKDGEAVEPGVTALGPGEQWIWIPPQDGLGIYHAFEIFVRDATTRSNGEVAVPIEVTPWTLALDSSAGEIHENGVPQPAVLTLTRVGDVTSPLDVQLLNSHPMDLVIPSSVNFPAGVKMLEIPVLIANDGEMDGNQMAIISAIASGYASGETSINVIDDDTSEHRTLGGYLIGTIVKNDYVVIQDLHVVDGQTLTIEPGAQLAFAAERSVQIPDNSTLIAIGSEDDRIVFTSASPSPTAGDWQGITIGSFGAERTMLVHTDIAYATIAIQNRDRLSARFDLRMSEIREMSVAGVSVIVGYGNFLGPTAVQVIGNSIHSTSGTGIDIGALGISGSPPRSGSNQMWVESNEIYATNVGISAWSSYAIAGGTVGSASAAPTLLSNQIHDNQIGISGSASKPSGAFGNAWLQGEIANNLIFNNNAHAIALTRNAGIISTAVLNNTLVNNGGSGISHDTLLNSAQIKNNNIVGNMLGIESRSQWVPALGQVTHNNVWGNSTLDWRNYPEEYGVADGTNANGTAADFMLNINESPSFVAEPEADFRLKPNSPLIDAADESSDFPPLDIHGVTRNLVPDIGASETIPVVPSEMGLTVAMIPENSPLGSVVGGFWTTDDNAGDEHIYTLVAGDGDSDNGSFTIVDDQLAINVNLDFEHKSNYQIRVRSTDLSGLFMEKEFVISVIDLPELVAEVQFGDGTSQRSSVTSILMTFDNDIEIAEGAFVFEKLGAGGGPVTTHYQKILNGVGQTEVLLTFSGDFVRNTLHDLLDGNYQLKIDGTKISRNGRLLDIDGDGSGGDELIVGDEEADNFFALYGDVNGDRVVGFQDFVAFRTVFGGPSDSSPTSTVLDYDRDGVVGFADFVAFRNRFGRPLGFQ